MDDGQNTAGGGSLEILLVEHDLDDAKRLDEALQRTGAEYRLEEVSTNAAALGRLQSALDDSAIAMPDLVFVDLELPDTSAHRLLAEICCHDDWRTIPVVALASPLSDDASLEAFDLQAWSCVSKTAELPIFADRLRRAMRCCLGDFPLRVGAIDPVSRSQVAEALVFKLHGDRTREPQATAPDTWQPHRREKSFWRRRRSA